MTLLKTVYTSTMVKPPNNLLTIRTSLRKIIWNGRRPKTTHSTLVDGYAEGRFKDVNMQ